MPRFIDSLEVGGYPLGSAARFDLRADRLNLGSQSPQFLFNASGTFRKSRDLVVEPRSFVGSRACRGIGLSQALFARRQLGVSRTDVGHLAIQRLKTVGIRQIAGDRMCPF